MNTSFLKLARCIIVVKIFEICIFLLLLLFLFNVASTARSLDMRVVVYVSQIF